jgi:tyrosyl-tRNA synthetase
MYMVSEDLLHHNVAELIGRDEVEKRIAAGEKLRVKLGVDPSKPDLHIGHALTLRKLRAFQDAGHTAVLIIGDYTAQLGDPSDRTEARKILSVDEVKRNAEGYLAQVFMILDEAETEVHYQTEWFNDFTLRSVVELASTTTVNHMLSHETFGERIKNNQPLHVHELLYPLMQGYDSVAIKADIELGATDQKFNILMGRIVQRAHDMSEQAVMLLKYLPGLDGNEKMSKSLGNTINLTDTPEDVFGKIMSMPDRLIPIYFERVTTVSDTELEAIKAELSDGAVNPRDVKEKLARKVVSELHGDQAAVQAADAFAKVFRERKTPDTMETLVLAPGQYDLIDILANRTVLAASKSEARRLIAQGGVRVDGDVVADSAHTLVSSDKEVIIQVGPRRFVKIEWKAS